MKKTPWYKDENFWGNVLTGLAGVGGVLSLFAPHTAAYKIGAGISITSGVIMKLRGKYQKDELPSGLSKQLDKISNKYTGIKGSKNNGGKGEK